jgi:excisionase family DNA binding protein
MSVDEIAFELGISRNAAYAAVRNGEIPSIRIGKRIIIPRAAFERLLEQGGDSDSNPVPGDA